LCANLATFSYPQSVILPNTKGINLIMQQPIRQPKISFSHFLKKFPEIPLPITLGEEAHHAFSQRNESLPPPMIERYIEPLEEKESDEFTEFIPCLSIPKTDDFYAIVYWRAMLMSYEYTLATFSKKGELIDHRVIAGMFSDGQLLVNSVATIDKDWMIYIVSGKSKADKTSSVDPQSSTATTLELLPEGNMVEHL
jgi:hypothetical protein